MTDTFAATPPPDSPPPAAPPEPPEPAEAKEKRPHEFLAAVLLGLAAVLTSLAAYQASLKDGEALESFTKSTRTLNDANAFYDQSNQIFARDNQLFIAFATASQEGNFELADYLTTLMRPEMVEAVDWWRNTEEAITPFDDLEDNPYIIEDQGIAVSMEEDANTQFEEATTAGEKGDKFQLATIILAVCLFFGGITNIFRRHLTRTMLLVIAAGLMAVGSVVLINAFGS